MNLKGKTNAELVAMQDAIQQDPASFNPVPSIFIYSPAARRKLDAIARAITENLRLKRQQEGNPVPCDGYSGRQSNRR